MTPERQAEIDALYEQLLPIESSDAQDRLLKELSAQYSAEAVSAVRQQLAGLRRAEAWMNVRVQELGESVCDRRYLAAGTQVDHFEIRSVIGEGGMGVVYEASDTRFPSRRVALKMVSSDTIQSAREEALRRFRQEYGAAGRLEHDGFVRIFDVGTWMDQPYIAMQFVAGGTLKDHRKQGSRWQQGRAAEFVRRLSLAMHHAHLRGIVHRDLKPANILLTGDLQPRITDFGIARDRDSFQQPTFESTTDQPASAAASAQDPALTRTPTLGGQVTPGGGTRSDQFLGTACYSAPEQIRGEMRPPPPPGHCEVEDDIPPVTAQTDIYALGVILYELLTGELPFPPDDSRALFRDIVYTTPLPPTERANDLDRDLEAICLKCLARKPDDRYSSANALADDLQRYLKHEPVDALPPSSTRRLTLFVRRHPTLASGAAIVTAALLFILFSTIRHSITLENKNTELAQEVAERNRIDRERLKAEQKARQELLEGYLSRAETMLWQDAQVSALPWLAAGLQLAGDQSATLYFRTRILNTIRRLPLMIHPLFHDHRVNSFGFDHSATRILTTSASDALIWDAQTGREWKRLSHPDTVLSAEFSRDSRQILTVCLDDRLRVWSQDSTQPDWQFSVPQGYLQGAKFSPDGSLVASLYYHPEQNDESGSTNTDDVGSEIIDSGGSDISRSEAASAEAATSYGHVYFHSADGELQASIRLNQLTTETETSNGTLLMDYLSKVSFHPRQPLAFLANGAEVLAFNVESAEVTPFPNPIEFGDLITAIQCSPDGASLAIGGVNDRFQVFELKSGLRRWHDHLVHHGTPVFFQFSEDNQQLYSMNESRTQLYTWDTYSGASAPLKASLTLDAITNANANIDGRMQLQVCADQSVKVFDLASAFPQVLKLNLPVENVYPGPSGRFVTFKSEQNRTYTFDIQKGAYLRSAYSVEPHYMADESALLLPYNSVTSINLKSGEVTKNRFQTEPPGQIAMVTSSPDGKQVATMQGGRVNVFHAAGDEHHGTLEHEGLVYRMQFSPDSERLTTVSVPPGSQGTTDLLHSVAVWECRNLSLVHELKFPTKNPEYRFFGDRLSEDGQWIAAICSDSRIRVWNVNSELPRCEIPTQGHVTHLEITKPGSQLAWVEGSSTVNLWDISQNRNHKRNFQFSSPVAAIAFESTGKAIAIATRDKSAQVWDVGTGHSLTVPLVHDSVVRQLRFNSFGTQLTTLTADNGLHFWDVGDDSEWSDDELVRLCSFLSSSEVVDKLDFPLSRARSDEFWDGIGSKYGRTFAVRPLQVNRFHSRLAEVAQENKQWQLQLKHLRPLMEQMPNWPNYHFLAAQAHHHSGQAELAKREFAETLRLAPQQNDWRLMSAWSLRVNRDWDACIAETTLGLDDNGGLNQLDDEQRHVNEARFREYRAVALASTGRFAEAEADFHWLKQKKPEELQFVRSLALTYLAQQKTDAYLALRKELIGTKRFTESKQANTLSNLFRTCILYPFETREMRKRIFRIGRDSMSANLYQSSHIARLVQAIHSELTLRQLQSNLEKSVRDAKLSAGTDQPIEAHLGLAIIVHRLGNRSLALRYLQSATESIERLGVPEEDADWDRILEYRLLAKKTAAELEGFPDTSLIDSLLGYLPPSDEQLSDLIRLTQLRLNDAPDDGLALETLAQALAEMATRKPGQANWNEIAETFRKSRQQSPDSSILWFYEGLALLKSDRSAEHIVLCEEMRQKFLSDDRPLGILTTLRTCSLWNGTVPQDPTPLVSRLVPFIRELFDRDFDASHVLISVGGFLLRCAEAADTPAARNQFINHCRSLLVPTSHRLDARETSDHEVLRQVPLMVMLYTSLGAEAELQEWVKAMNLWRERLPQPMYENKLPWYQRVEFELLVAQADQHLKRFNMPVEAPLATEPETSEAREPRDVRKTPRPQD